MICWRVNFLYLESKMVKVDCNVCLHIFFRLKFRLLDLRFSTLTIDTITRFLRNIANSTRNSKIQLKHTSLEVSVGQKKELLIPPIWGCCGPTGGSIFTPGQKNHPAFFEGRWYTGKMARQIWAEWAVCLSSYLWKGWMVFLPRGKNWTSSRSTTTPDRWYWKFFFLANWHFQWCVGNKLLISLTEFSCKDF